MPEMIITRDHESPPLTFGPRRVHYSYSVALPQMHLTFVSVLEGLALSQLLVGIPLPHPSEVGAYLLAQHGYLPYIVSGLLILLIWKQFAHNSTFSFWPPSTSQLGLTLLIAVAQILAFRVIGDFGEWLIGLGLTGMLGGVIRLNNMRLQVPGDWESDALDRLVRRTNRRDGTLYLLLGGVTVLWGLGVLRLEESAGASSSLLLGAIIWVGSLTLLAALGIVEWLDNKLRKAIIAHAIDRSDLEMTRAGRVHYRGPFARADQPTTGSAADLAVETVSYEGEARFGAATNERELP